MKILKQNQKIDENRLYDLVLKYQETVVLSASKNFLLKSTFTGNDKTTCFYKSKLFYSPHFHISEEKLLQKQENQMFCENKLLLN